MVLNKDQGQLNPVSRSMLDTQKKRENTQGYFTKMYCLVLSIFFSIICVTLLFILSFVNFANKF